MKRAFRAPAFLSLILACGPISAQAQVARAIVVTAAPAPVVVAPLSASAVPLCAAASPALGAFVAAPDAAFLAVPVVAAPAPAEAFAFAAPARVAAVVQTFAAPTTAARPQDGSIFDGALRAAAADDVAPVRAPPPGPAAAPRLARASAAGRILRFAALGSAVAAASPALWSAAPSDGQLILLAFASLPILAASALLLAGETIRAAYRQISGVARVRPAAPSRRRVWGLRAAGFALGLALTTAVSMEKVPLTVDAHAYGESRAPVAERVISAPIPGKSFGAELTRSLARTPEGRAALERVGGRMPVFVVTQTRQPFVAVPGPFIADETSRILSQDPVGRKVIDGLRDRGGVLRMPAFYVSYQNGSEAYYAPPESVTLSAASIEAGGVTVARFLRDPAAQTAYVEREQGVLAHELEHAAQARRSPFDSDTRTLLTTNAARLIAAIEAYVRPAPASPKTPSAPSAEADAPAALSPAVIIDGDALARAGIPVERFRSDAALQKEYIASHQAELARALRAPAPAAAAPERTSRASAAAASARRAFHFDDGNIMEWEYEAYFTEHFYTYERLKADPAGDFPSDELARFSDDLLDFDAFLKSKDSNEIYAGNFHSRSAYYSRYMADMRARWDAHRVDAFVLLARRDQALGHPAAAHRDMESARRIAAERGLPKPALPGK